MAAIVFSQNAKARWLTGVAGVRAKARDMAQRAMSWAAATVLICAVVAALVQLAAEILSFPAPLAVTGITLMAVALLHSLRRHLRTQPGRRYGLEGTAKRPALSQPGSARARFTEHHRPPGGCAGQDVSGRGPGSPADTGRSAASGRLSGPLSAYARPPGPRPSHRSFFPSSTPPAASGPHPRSPRSSKDPVRELPLDRRRLDSPARLVDNAKDPDGHPAGAAALKYGRAARVGL